MDIQNISGYKFIGLEGLSSLRQHLLEKCEALECRGTILLSEEGINLNLSGKIEHIQAFKDFLWQDPRFQEIQFRESYSSFMAFKRLKIKIKPEIITMRCREVRPGECGVPTISPTQLKQWLDENRNITLLDTRNAYELQFGTFKNAIHCNIHDFSEFAEASEKLPCDGRPIVIYCTGGIRCEKAGLHLLNQGHTEVYQLAGGILNYFAEVGGAHYQGECFVFDDRIALNEHLQETGTAQCQTCQGPIHQPTTTVAMCSCCIQYLT